MVLFELIINCECENIDAITIGKDYEWHLKLKCYSCHMDIDEVYFKGSDEVDVQNSRGTCNFQMKCKTCQQMINITLDKRTPDFVKLEERTKNVKLAFFEFRGGEPVSWNSKGVYVRTPNGTIFEDVDLTDTWVEYDEKAATNCLIDNFKSVFQKSNQK